MKRKTIEELREIFSKKENELRAVKEYLNENGKALIVTLNVIYHELCFCRTYEDIFENEIITEMRTTMQNDNFIRSFNFHLNNAK